MSWIAALGDQWLATVGWLVGLGAVFAVLARAWPCNPGMCWWKDLRALRTDLLYWFLVPLVMLVGRGVLLVAAAVLVLGGPPAPGPMAGWPLWQQAVLVLLLQDVLLYWLHRAFHTRPAWPFHAVHHSPHVLDWTALARFHPVNQLLEFAVADIAILLLGFPPVVLVVLAPFNLIYSAMVHANLNWTFGPLRYVLASPVFHRWHHTSEAEGLDRNFASTFPLLDLLFRTFYMPAGRRPEVFGIREQPVPPGFLAQLAYPFRKANPMVWSMAVGVLLAAGLLGGWGHVAAPLAGPASSAVPDAAPAVCGRMVAEFRPEGATTVALSANGGCVAWGDTAGRVTLRDIETGEEQATPIRHERRVTGLAITADAGCVISGGADGRIAIWVRGEADMQEWDAHRGGVTGLALAADGSRIVSGGADGTVRVWHRDGTPERTLRAEGVVTAVATDATGSRIAAGVRRVARMWDTATGREVVLRGHTEMVSAVALTGDGRRAVTGSLDGLVMGWDAATGQVSANLGRHRGPTTAVAVSADGSRIVSGGAGGAVQLRDASTSERVGIVCEAGAGRAVVAVSAGDGRVAVLSSDGMIRIRETPR